jgi:hypothetical protein
MYAIEAVEDTLVLTGHYGSGKTEVAVNLAFRKRENKKDIAIIDLDIANPYFRSREMQGIFSEKGINLISNAYGHDIAADLPALSPMIGRYLESGDVGCIVDVGGNDSGARILNQYRKQLNETGAKMYMVVNVYRPETDSAEKIVRMIDSIKSETGQDMHGLINNSNLLKATSEEHIVSSMSIVEAASELSGIPIVCHCCEERFIENLSRHSFARGTFMPIKLHMRPEWLDM